MIRMIKISGEIHSSKNSRQIHFNNRTKRPFVAKSTAAKDDEELLASQLADDGCKQEWKSMVSGRDYPLYVNFHFVRKTRARWDFANLVQGIADALVKAGYLIDDDVEHFIPLYGGHHVDKKDPGVLFWVDDNPH